MAIKHANLWEAGEPALTDTDWNAGHVVDTGGILMEASGNTPATPAAGTIALWARQIAGRNLPASVDQNGLATWMQPFVGRNRIGLVLPMGNSSAQITTMGLPGLNVVGTATARTVETTNLLKSTQRIGYVSGTTVASRSQIGFSLSSMFFRGSAAGLGGFTTVLRFGTSDAATVAGARTFVGMAATFGGLDPSSYTNIIGVGHDSADSTYHIIHNDGAGTATKVNLGTDFPANTLSEDLYELALFCPPNASSVFYQFTRVNRPDIAPAVGQITTDLPAGDFLMMPFLVRGNGPTAAAVGIDLVSIYTEKDN